MSDLCLMDVVKFQKDSVLQRIKASYIEEDFELTDHEEIIKKRLLHYHSLRFDKKYSRHQAVKIHAREMGVSKATAYRDAQQSEFIMGNIEKSDVEFERALFKESYWNLYQMNLKKGNLEAANKALDSAAKLINWNASEQKINPEKLEASEIRLQLDTVSREIFKQQFASGVVDMNSIDVTDVDYKEVIDEEEDSSSE